MSEATHYGQIIHRFRAEGHFFAKILDLESQTAAVADLGEEPPKVDLGYVVTFELDGNRAVNVESSSEAALPEGLEPVVDRDEPAKKEVRYQIVDLSSADVHDLSLIHI